MEQILDIITATGTVVAAGSIISAFALYRLQKTDEYLSEVRKALQNLSNSISELNDMIDFELAYELSAELVRDPLVQPSIRKLYNVCNEIIANKENEKDAKEKIQEVFGVFGTSFQNPLAIRYSTTISNITQQAVTFYPAYKGLFRFSKACAAFMNRLFTTYKRMIIDEDLLTVVVYNELVCDNEPWDSFEDFQKSFLDYLVSLVGRMQADISQKDIDCICELVNMVYSAHIELSRHEWKKLKRKSKRIRLVPDSQIKTITGDLREAEKCFREVMDRDQSNRYASLVQTIELSVQK